jgi:hypothetical protein
MELELLAEFVVDALFVKQGTGSMEKFVVPPH